MTGSPIRHAKLMVVYVSDQSAALAYYTDVLGLELVRDVTYRDGTRWIEVNPPGAASGLTLGLADEVNEGVVGGFTRVILTTDDIDAAHAELTGRGVVFQGPVLRTGEVPAMALFEDPEGNRFLLLERDD